MLQRIVHSSGVVVYHSPLLGEAGVVHAFSTRIGGVSPAPFDSMNLGNPSGIEVQDSAANIAENYRRLQAAIGANGMARAWVRQVHGRTVELLERETESDYSETLAAEIRDRFSGQLAADALVTREPGVLLTIRAADCVPVLLASQEGNFVGAAHAGWRGIVGNVIGKTVRALLEAGAPAGSLVAGIGPSISVEHFEVGEEVAAEFDRQGLGFAVLRSAAAKPHVDLQAAAAHQLAAAGVAQVDGNDRCSFRDESEFFSHRRDAGITGRMAAFIAGLR